MRTSGRVDRWWSRGFVLLGLAVCAILPLGAIGTIDASFDSSVAVPLFRTAGGNHGRQAAIRTVSRGPSAVAVGERHHVPVRPSLLATVPAPAPAPIVTALALLLLALVVWPPGHRAAVGLPPRRGPPSYR